MRSNLPKRPAVGRLSANRASSDHSSGPHGHSARGPLQARKPRSGFDAGAGSWLSCFARTCLTWLDQALAHCSAPLTPANAEQAAAGSTISSGPCRARRGAAVDAAVIAALDVMGCEPSPDSPDGSTPAARACQRTWRVRSPAPLPPARRLASRRARRPYRRIGARRGHLPPRDRSCWGLLGLALGLVGGRDRLAVLGKQHFAGVAPALRGQSRRGAGIGRARPSPTC